MANSDEDDCFLPSTNSRRSKSARRKSTPAATTKCRKKARSSTPQARQGLGQITLSTATVQTPASVAVSSEQRAPSACTPSRDLELVQSCERPPSEHTGDQGTSDGFCSSISAAAQQQQLDTNLAAQQPEGRSSIVQRCPVCEVDLTHISHTEAGRAAHVNACLDAGATHVPDTPASLPICIADTQAPQELPGEEDEPDSMQQWLEGIDAAEVAGVFSEAEIDLCVLPHLNDNDLQELGIADVELRSRILQAAAAAGQPATTHHPTAGTSQQQPQQQQQATNMQDFLEDQQPHSEEQQPDGHEGWQTDLLCSPGDGDEQWDYADAYMPQQHMSQQQWQAAEDWQEELPGNQQQDWQQQQQQQQQDGGADWQQQQQQQGDDGVDRQPQQWQDGHDRLQQQQHQQQWQDDGADWQQQQQWQDQELSVYTQQSDQDHANQHSKGLQQQAAQHAGPLGLVGTFQQQQQQHQVAWQHRGVQGQQWQQHGCQVQQPPQQQHPTGPQQQLPQQQRPLGPLRVLDINLQQQAAATGSDPSSSMGQQAQQTGAVQSSITGFVTRQARQPPPQQRDAKEQWRALFKLPKQPLGAHNPQTQRQQPRQAQLSAQGRVVRATEQQQPAAAAAAESVPPPVLPQAAGPSLPSWWPAWQRLPGTNIIVDCFGRSCASVGSNRTWILSHFHADHYMGLSKGFKQGRIICSPITAALVRLKLRVPPERLLVLELGQEIQVEGTRLQLIEANHCPGAAMIVAQPPGGAPPVLHTGDARLTVEATRSQAVLRDLVGRAVLVLDTTYADPTYCFPPQQDVLDWVLKAVKAEMFNPRCLLLFGTYTIGKERLFMHVATALQRKVYVAAAKRSIMSCLNLPPEQSALLTTNHLDANIHAVPMRQVTLEAMESLLLRYKGRYTAVVGFKPTGWSHAGGSGRNGQGAAAAAAAAAAVSGPSRSSLSIKPNRRRSQRGTVVMYQVPYSEHSSCAELRSFVEWFKPLRIIPSVNNDGSNGTKLKAMLAAVTASTGPATGPMDIFARPQQQRQQQRQ